MLDDLLDGVSPIKRCDSHGKTCLGSKHVVEWMKSASPKRLRSESQGIKFDH